MVIARPYAAQEGFQFSGYGAPEVLGTYAQDAPFGQISRLDRNIGVELGRQAMRAFPDADTIMFPSPHWPAIDAIEPLERELGVSVMSALQAIVWDALRLTGIDDRLDGFGRLLREF